MIKVITLFAVMILLTSCGGGKTETHGSETYSGDYYSAGKIKSTDTNYIEVDDSFYRWELISSTELIQILLRVYELPSGHANDPALWALAVRIQPNPSGIVYASDMEVKLFSNYTENTEICCQNIRPFSEFDQADVSYLGVSGYVNFNSEEDAVFEIGFQKETELGSGVTTGQIVTVSGCWFVGNSANESGCEIE